MSQARRARLCTAGKITQRNTDARFYTRLEDGTSPKKNFFIYYELDDEEVKTYLCTNWYNGEDDGSWVLIDARPPRAAPAPEMRSPPRAETR